MQTRIMLSITMLTLISVAPLAKAGLKSPLISLDYPKVLSGKPTSVYLLAQFEAEELVVANEPLRKRLNLSMVLDRSGSMADKGKLEYSKEAAKILVDKLASTDHLAIVEYDDVVTVMYPSAPVEAPDLIKRLIDGLKPRNNTNLTGGMMKGVDEVKKGINGDYIHRVILMSDGLANQGIVNPVEIRNLVRETKAQNIRISTMGLGSDFNEDLMKMIAENSGGNYYFIENPEQMRRIYERELDILFKLVANKIVCRFVPSNIVTKVEIFGYLSETQNGAKLIQMEDFYAGETRSLLIRLDLNRSTDGDVLLGEFKFDYFDLLANDERKFAIPVKAEAVDDTTVVVKNQNKNVVIEAALFEADKQHESYVRQFEAGQHDLAAQNVQILNSKLLVANAGVNDVRLSKKIEQLGLEAEEFDRASKDQTFERSMIKKRKESSYKSQRGTRGSYMMQEKDKGFEVEQLQRVLKDQGFYKGTIDGNFSPDMTEAIKAFQRSKNMDPDGIAGPLTLKALGLY